MNATDLSALDGRIVLVCSAQDHRNPPSAMRGTLRVRDGAPEEGPAVVVELDFPQMFATRAHHRAIPLSDADVAQLLSHEPEGPFTITISDPLDPQAPAGE